jgi:hypothetical protein
MIIDEAHERTLHTDILFGLVKDIAKVRRQQFTALCDTQTNKCLHKGTVVAAPPPHCCPSTLIASHVLIAESYGGADREIDVPPVAEHRYTLAAAHSFAPTIMPGYASVTAPLSTISKMPSFSVACTVSDMRNCQQGASIQARRSDAG